MKLWEDHAPRIKLDGFRAHNQYLGQPPEYPYAELLKYIRENTDGTLLRMLTEDGAFECPTATIDGRMVSRDMLDSIIEIHSLTRDDAISKHSWLPSNARVLDIGAGYGRFAHRFLTHYHDAFVYCTDAINVSLRVCEAYLKFRGIPNEGLVGMPCARVVDTAHLGEIGPLDLAVNIHSWPECSPAEVKWWLDWLRERKVPRLFCVPHTPDFAFADCGEASPGESFLPLIEAAGYKLETKWYGPDAWPRTFALFRLENT